MAARHSQNGVAFLISACLAGCGGIIAERTTPGPDAISDASLQPDAAPQFDAAPTSEEASAGVDAAGPWTPRAIQSRLAFWFDPTSIVQSGGKVTLWSDLSGQGNHAVQATAAFEPAYTPTGIAGLPSVSFTGPITFLAIADTATMRWGTGDFLVVAALRATAQTAPAAMLYQKTGPYPYDGVNLYLNANKPFTTSLAAAQVTGNVYVVSAPPPSTFVDASVHVLAARRTGDTLEIRVDGVVSNALTNPSVAAVDVSAAGLTAVIGQNGYGTPSSEFQQVHGDIAEMIAVRGSLGPLDLTNLERYLIARYAVR